MKIDQNYFTGTWRFERVIHDALQKAERHANGLATFTPGFENELIYNEQGYFMDQLSGEFYRSYRYVFADTKLDVFFHDGPSTGQLFQTLNLSVDQCCLIANADHLCGADCYQGHYDLVSPDEFIITYDVSGPRKNYQMKTIYKRHNPAKNILT